MLPELLHKDDWSEVYVGDCLDPEHVATIMGNRRANALIVDAPYSEKTHAGHKAGKLTADRAAGWANANANANASAEARYAAKRAAKGTGGRRDLAYDAFDRDKIGSMLALWQCEGWRVSITDDVLAPVWSAAMRADRLYVFAPLPLVEIGSRCRLLGDGPSAWTCWIVVGRPRTAAMAKWGTLPGAYVQGGEPTNGFGGDAGRIVGGKPLGAMLGIVRDYSHPGDLVVDPCCGAGTTGLAARMLGRRCVMVDRDPKHAAIAARRVAQAREQTRMPWADSSG